MSLATDDWKDAAQAARKVEADPNGLSLNTPGAKADAGKTRHALMTSGFARALNAVAEVTTYGAEKYSPNGWMHVVNGKERYADAMARHLNAADRGQLTDKDSGLLHLAHSAWNCLALLELFLREQEKHAQNPVPLDLPVVS